MIRSLVKWLPANEPTGGQTTWKTLVAMLRAAGPYLTVELLLPGGSIIALLLWLYRSRHLVTPDSTRCDI